MTTMDFITTLFYEVDEQMRAVPKHPEAHLWPSEVVTLGLLHALKGVGNRAFYRWLTRDYRPLFPRLPERTRLLRLFRTHQDWTQVFLAAPTVLGVIDTYGIELIHPMREGRSPQQIGRKGPSTQRWIVGGTLCLLLNQDHETREACLALQPRPARPLAAWPRCAPATARRLCQCSTPPSSSCPDRCPRRNASLPAPWLTSPTGLAPPRHRHGR